ncbi:hypothetical protein JNW88_07385 [Micromonospora sp. ATA32]|nr:hypothetical protein [Micromonospora sp. ATA32]
MTSFPLALRTGRSPAALSLAVLGLVATAGCTVANSSSNESSAQTGTVRIVLPQEPPTLEPCESTLTSTGVVVRSNITEPLLERNPTSGGLEPLLATKWEQSAPNVWTFTLRQGVKFQDGSDFTAEDAVASFDRAVNNSALACTVKGYVFDEDPLVLKAVDATTLTVETKQPDPLLPLRASFVEIVPAETSAKEKVREPVGTGPYKVAKWDAGQKLTLEAFPGYWGDKPGFGRAEYQWRDEGSVRAAMIVNGEADIATNLGSDDGAGDKGIAYPNNETTALRISTGEAPLNDIRIREAIDLSVDRDGIVKTLFANLGKPASQLIGPGVVGYNDALKPTPYDPHRAKQLVAEAKAAGVPVDKQIRLIARTAQFPKIAETVELVQSALADAGLNVKIEMLDTSAQLKYQQKPYPPNAGPYMVLVQHGNQAGDAAFTVDQYYKTDGAQSANGSVELDNMIDKAGALLDDARQVAFADVFKYQNEKIRGFVFIANMSGVLGRGDKVDYHPDAATGDEMRLSQMKPKG